MTEPPVVPEQDPRGPEPIAPREKEPSPSGQEPGQQDAFTALSYILAGLLLYGGLGWLGDHFLHTRFLLPIGLLLGAGLGIYLVIRRYGNIGSRPPSDKDQDMMRKPDL